MFRISKTNQGYRLMSPMGGGFGTEIAVSESELRDLQKQLGDIFPANEVSVCCSAGRMVSTADEGTAYYKCGGCEKEFIPKTVSYGLCDSKEDPKVETHEHDWRSSKTAGLYLCCSMCGAMRDVPSQEKPKIEKIDFTKDWSLLDLEDKLNQIIDCLNNFWE